MLNVLLVNPFGIGDVLFTVPLLKALRKNGVKRIDVILGSRTGEVLRHTPYVDEIISIDKDGLKQSSFWKVASYIIRLLIKLRARRYDTLIDLSLTREYAFWSAFVLGIRRRAGFDYKGRGIFLTERIRMSEGFTGKHVMEFYKDLAALLSLDISEFHLEWHTNSDEERTAFDKVSQAGLDTVLPFLAVAPGGGASWGKDAVFKQWAPEKFARFLFYLSREWEVGCAVIIGSEDEKGLAARLKQSCPLNIFDLTGKLSIGETAALVRKSICFVGNDGGLLHLAKAVGRPTISIFGPVDDRIYGPFPKVDEDAVIFHRRLDCRPCYRKFRYRSDCEHRACLTELGVDEALRQLKEQPFIQRMKARFYETAR
ncbi:MAG: glycosyltransferase family 9 protein [Candidatus Omnitrophica bacterium]|nr:glycosyltransferase family 9 protein [Candidatus Omnitrophota bacterium]